MGHFIHHRCGAHRSIIKSPEKCLASTPWKRLDAIASQSPQSVPAHCQHVRLSVHRLAITFAASPVRLSFAEHTSFGPFCAHDKRGPR